MTPPRNIQWAAGLFEGEGSTFTFVNRPNASGIPYAYPWAELGMTDADAVHEFARIVGGKVNGPYSSGDRRKPIYRWCARGKAADKVLRRLLPYLCQRRKEKVMEVLAAPRGRIA